MILQSLIADGYEPVKVNMLLSIAYHMNGDTVMSDKYRAISNLMQLRELNRVPIVDERKSSWVPKASEMQ